MNLLRLRQQQQQLLLLLVLIALAIAPTTVKSWGFAGVASHRQRHSLECNVHQTNTQQTRHHQHLHPLGGGGGEVFYQKDNDISLFSKLQQQANPFRLWNHLPIRRRFLVTLAVAFLLLVVGPRMAMAEVATMTTAALGAAAEPPLVAATVLPTAAAAAAVAAKSASTATTTALHTLVNGRPALSIAMELRLSLRLIFAALVGALVGWERSSSKHAAGVRTLSLVSMAAAAYTICSSFGFIGFPRVDPSRMASNVASGVGFIGAGVITTSTLQQHRGDDSTPFIKSPLPPNTVHGLTTAAAIWLSAAVGVACGVGLYFVASTAALTTIAILRLGRVKPPSPRNKTKNRKSQQQQQHASPPHHVDLNVSRDSGSATQQQQQHAFPTQSPPSNEQASRTPEYIDDEMELVVRSAWQNATNSSSSRFPTDNSGLLPLSRIPSSFGNGGPTDSVSP